MSIAARIKRFKFKLMASYTTKKLIALGQEPSANFEDMQIVSSDGLDEVPWDGPTFEEWQRSH